MIFKFKDYRKIPGIYKFENKVNNKCYIIKAKDICKSVKKQLNTINNININIDNIFYNDIKEAGLDNFDIDIIEAFDKKTENIDELLNEKYEEYIIKYDSLNNGYNIIDKVEDNKKETDDNAFSVDEQKIYMFNVNEKYYQTWCNSKYTEKYTGYSEDDINNAAYSENDIIIDNKWIVSLSKYELEERIKRLHLK